MSRAQAAAIATAIGAAGLAWLWYLRRRAAADGLREEPSVDAAGAARSVPALRSSAGSSNYSHNSIAREPIAEEEEEEAAPESQQPLTPEEAWAEAIRVKERGNKRFQGRQYDLAVKDYTRAIAIAPDRTDERAAAFFCNRAASLSMLGDYEGVLRDCDEALAISPKYVKALNRRGDAREKLGQLDGALLDFTGSCLLTCFEQTTSVQSADRVLKAIGQRNAEAHGNGAKRMPSPNFFKTFLDSFVSHRRLLAPASGTIITSAEARKRAEAAMDQDPAKRASLIEEEAIALMHEQQYEEALCAWERAVEAWYEKGAAAADADAGRSHNMLGTLLHLRGKLDEALVHYDKALALQPREGNTLVKRASLNYEMMEQQKCAADLAAADSLLEGTERADFHCHRGQILMLSGQLEASVEELRAGLKVDSSVMLAHIQLAIALTRLGRRTEASEVFKEAEAKFPQSPDVRNFRAEVMLEAGDAAGAMTMCDEAIAVGGDRLAAAYVSKANAVLMSTNGAGMEEAVSLFKKAVAVDPLSEGAHMHLAQAYWQSSELKMAVEHYDHAIDLIRNKDELKDAYSMREAAQAHLTLLSQQPAIYEPAIALNKQRAGAAAAAAGR